MSAAEVEAPVERTLHIAREVNVFKIPPRPAAGGFRSGEWRISDKIFTGRLRVMSVGEACQLRLEASESGELFAMCPVPLGQREICVEPVVDSSRYFVLRVVDPASGRHAFLGMGFDERGDAFDFSAALSDHERHVTREKEAKVAAASGKKVEDMPSDLAALYQSRGDLSIKEGQTITVSMNLKSKSKPGGGGFMSRQMEVGQLGKLAPPQTAKPLSPPPLTPPPNSAAAAHPPNTGGVGSTTSGTEGAQGWATFD